MGRVGGSHMKVPLAKRVARAREVAYVLCQLHSKPGEFYHKVNCAIRKLYRREAFKRLAPETFATALVRWKWQEVPGDVRCPFLSDLCELAGTTRESVLRVLGRMG